MTKSEVGAEKKSIISQGERQNLDLDINIDIVSFMVPVYEYETPVGKALVDALGNEINGYSLTEAGRFREILYGVDSIVRPCVENNNVDSIHLNLSVPEQENAEIIDALETTVLKGGISITVCNEVCNIENNSINNPKITKKKIKKTTESDTINLIQSDAPLTTTDHQPSKVNPNPIEKVTQGHQVSFQDQYSKVNPNPIEKVTSILSLGQTTIGEFGGNKKLGETIITNLKNTPFDFVKIGKGDNGLGVYSGKYNGGGRGHVKILGNFGDLRKICTKVGKYLKIGGLVGLLDVPEYYTKIQNAENFKDAGVIGGEIIGGTVGGRVGATAGTLVGTVIIGTVVGITAPVSLLILGGCVIVGTVLGSLSGKYVGGKVGGEVGEMIDSSGTGEIFVELAKDAGKSLERLPEGFFSGPKW